MIAPGRRRSASGDTGQAAGASPRAAPRAMYGTLTDPVLALLGQVGGVIASVTADGAYDGEPTYAAAAARQLHPPLDVVAPPRASAVPLQVATKGARTSGATRCRTFPLSLFSALPPGGDPPLVEVACWSHARRKFYDVHHATASPIALDALQRIAALFAIEASIRAARPSAAPSHDGNTPSPCWTSSARFSTPRWPGFTHMVDGPGMAGNTVWQGKWISRRDTGYRAGRWCGRRSGSVSPSAYCGSRS